MIGIDSIFFRYLLVFKGFLAIFMKVCLNGRFLTDSKAKISALDNGFLYGDGVYETITGGGGKMAHFALHMERFNRSARTIGINIPWTSKQIKNWVEQLLVLNKLKNARIRISLSRGVNGMDFTSCKKPTLLIQAERLNIDPKIYKNGVAAVVIKSQRIWPEVKSMGLIHMIQAYRKLRLKSGMEGIMIDDNGFVREGITSNVFMVLDGVIFTAKNKILSGIIRGLVLRLAKKLVIKALVKDFKISKLRQAEEIFITNSVKKIVPVTSLDGKKVGDGRIGAITQKLMEFDKNISL